jgi:hypothetical protein
MDVLLGQFLQEPAETSSQALNHRFIVVIYHDSYQYRTTSLLYHQKDRFIVHLSKTRKVFTKIEKNMFL